MSDQNDQSLLEEMGRNIKGAIGEYLICHVLSQWGIHAVLTRYNAKGADIIAWCPENFKACAIQVKTGCRAYPGAELKPRDPDCERVEDDKAFLDSPQPDFVVFVKLHDRPFPEVDGVHVWHKSEKDLLRARKDHWALDGSLEPIRGGFGNPKDALECVANHLRSSP